MLKTRIYTAFVLLPLLVGALFLLPQMAWALFLAPLMLVGAWEWGVLAGWRVPGRIVYLAVIAVGGALLWQWGVGELQIAQRVAAAVFACSLIFWVVIAPLWLRQGWQVRADWLSGLVGMVLLLPLWLAMVQLQDRPLLLLMVMAIVWISDTAAYLCGRRWGKHKLAVAISPGKTWEGVVGAIAAVTAYYLILQMTGTFQTAGLTGVVGYFFCVVIVVLGIEGDLFESWIKRTVGVKDSGTIFPGHGGALDRIDALTSTLPAAALFLSLVK